MKPCARTDIKSTIMANLLLSEWKVLLGKRKCIEEFKISCRGITDIDLILSS